MTTMRPIRSLATALLVATLAVAGCARSQPDQTTPPAAQEPAVTAPAPKASTPAGGTDSQPVVLADGRHPVLLKTVDPDRRAITFDLIQLYFGEEGAREAAKDHQEFLNDMYGRNVSPRLRTLAVRRDAIITCNSLTAGYTGSATKDVRVQLYKLAILLPPHGSGPFWITVRHGQVVSMAEQYVP
jgi:hypothetical protein